MPYSWPINFRPPRAIRIRGTTPANGNRFDINFHTHPNWEAGNIVFHISVRYSNNSIVLNSRNSGGWQKEEHTQCLAIRRGGQFDFTIHCEHNYYRVDINGLPFAYFGVRQSYLDIRHVTLSGEGWVTTMSIEQKLINEPRFFYPLDEPSLYKDEPTESEATEILPE